MKSDSYNFIKNTFVKLTSKTYPYGFEDELVEEMTECGIFPKDLQKDIYGNYYLSIGDGSKTIFASHLDTACKDQVTVVHKFEKNIIKTNGKSILGADDKAGVTVMLWMIKNKIPGLYYFFFGEEVGCIGSGLRSKDIGSEWNRIISFDRRGTSSVITHQSNSRTCSDKFAKELAGELNNCGLNYRVDPTGVYTDSAEFTSVIPECTNLSVGYRSEHTFSEEQDIWHLHKLAEACLKVNWEELPTCRDPKVKEFPKSWEVSSRSYYDDWSANDVERRSWNNRGFTRKNKTWSNKNYETYSDAWDDYYEDLDRSKRSDRPKTYFDGGFGNLKDFDQSYEKKRDDSGKYESVKDKFFTTLLKKEEIETIREQYLDMKNPNDRNYYEVLINSLTY